MYAQGETVQWYDAALLFPHCPLSGTTAASMDGEDQRPTRSTTSNPYSPRPSPASRRGEYCHSHHPDPSGEPLLSPDALHRHVRQRACAQLAERLTDDTLSSDRDACASVAALVKSLRRGEVVHLADTAAGGTAPASRSCSPRTQATATAAAAVSSPLSEAAYPLLPETASSGKRHRSAPLSDRSRWNTGAVESRTEDGGDVIAALFASDSENDAEPLHNAAADSRPIHLKSLGFVRGAKEEEDDDAAVLGWGAAPMHRNGDSTATRQAQEARALRDIFASVPARIGVREEAVLCPLDTQQDPLRHVAAAAEVFVVVTAALPQTLYVFDQLNHLPISSRVLGGATFQPFTPSGSRPADAADGRGAAKMAAGSLAQSCGSLAANTGSSGPSPFAHPASLTSCTIDSEDTVTQLWLDPTGHYCVLVFGSGKCVYYHIPRRPTGATLLDPEGKVGAPPSTAGARKQEAKNTGEGAQDDGSDDGDDDAEEIQKRRLERHREWRAAARRWFRRRGNSNDRRRSNEDAEDGNDVAGGKAGRAGAVEGDVDAAYRPRGFSLCLQLPRSLGASATSMRIAGNSPFVPSCVGWCRHTSPEDRHGRPAQWAKYSTAVGEASGAAPNSAAPRGILKKGLATHTPQSTSSSPSPSPLPPPSAAAPTDVGCAGVLLGADRGGAVVACLLTPFGAQESRLVFIFPPPMAAAAIDGLVAICAPGLPLYGSGKREREREGADPASSAAPLADTRADGRSDRSARDKPDGSARRVRWEEDDTPAPTGGAALDGAAAWRHTSSIFRPHAYTAHFQSADAEQQDGGGDLARSAAVPGRGGRTDTPESQPRRSFQSASARDRHCRWVVLIAIKNRLYCFATPSTTLDMTALSAAPSPRTGRVEDVFVAYPIDSASAAASRARRVALTATTAAAATMTKSLRSNEGQPPLITADVTSDTAAAAAASHLANYITIEPSAMSKTGSTANAQVPSQVYTATPAGAAAEAIASPLPSPLSFNRADGDRASAIEDLSRATITTAGGASGAFSSSTRMRGATAATVGASAPSPAPFLLHSNMRGTLHVVLPPVAGHLSAYAADRSGGSALPPQKPRRVVPAALPPVFYWEFGGVVVQGVVLCGAGGLEVGAKVQQLLQGEAVSSPTRANDSPAKNDEAEGVVRSTGDAGGVSTEPGGLEARLRDVVDGALRETQDLNAYAQQSDGSVSMSTPPSTSPTAAAALARNVAGETSHNTSKSRRAETPTRAVRTSSLLPLGLLSVVNVNSCLQSLQRLLQSVAASRTRGRTAADAVQRGGDTVGGSHTAGSDILTFTTCRVRTTTATLSAATSAPPHGGDATMVEEAEEERHTAAAATALNFPVFQFPYTNRVVLCGPKGADGSARTGRNNKDNSTAAADDEGFRRHSHFKHASPGPPLHAASQSFMSLGSPTVAAEAAAHVGAGGSFRASERKQKVELTRSSMARSYASSATVPLLDDALRRGDVDETAMRGLRAVAAAYAQHAPHLFDTPVEDLLRATAAADLTERNPTAASAATAAAVFVSRGTAVPSSTATLNMQTSSSAASRVFSFSPSRVPGRLFDSATASLTPPERSMRAASPSRSPEDNGTRVRLLTAMGTQVRPAGGPSASLPFPLRRAHTTTPPFGAARPAAVAFSPLSAGDDAGGGRGEKKSSTVSTPAAAVAATAGKSGAVKSEEEEERVTLLPDGEVLVSFAASYTHVTFVTTQGVYVLAQAAPLPWEEAALTWRNKLVYHAVTATPTPSPSSCRSGVLYTGVADAAAPDMFYLASRSRLIRLQTPTLRSSAAGRRQFAVQLLMKAAAAAASGGSSSSTSRQEGGGGRTEREEQSRAREERAVVVVPLTLSYEVRLAGKLTDDTAERMDRGNNAESAFNPFPGREQHRRRRHRSESINVGSSPPPADADSASAHSSQPSHGSSSKLSQRATRLLHPIGAASSAASASASSPRDNAHGKDLDQTVTTASTLPVRPSHGEDAPHTRSLPPRPNSQEPLHIHQHPDMTGLPTHSAQHFLRHANRTALRSTLPSVASFTHVDVIGVAHQQQSASASMDSSASSTDVEGDVASGRLVRATTATTAAAVGPTAVYNTSPITPTFGGASGALSQLQMPRQGIFLALNSGSHLFDCNSPLRRTSGSSLRGVGGGVAENASFRGPNPAMFTHAAASPALQRAATTQDLRSGGVGEERQPRHVSPRGILKKGSAPVSASGKCGSLCAEEAARESGTAAWMAAVMGGSGDCGVAAFLRANPLLHYCFQHAIRGRDRAGETAPRDFSAAVTRTAPRKGAAGTLMPSCSNRGGSSGPQRAVNVPGFGVLAGSVGLTPLTPTSSIAVASLLLQQSIGSTYYCADHLYELALAACAVHVAPLTASVANASPSRFQTSEDRCLLHLVRHAYGGYLLTQRRYLEAAVQFGKAPEGPTPMPTVLVELVRAWRDGGSSDPLTLFLRLRLRGIEDSEKGLGGCGVAVSVLTTWLLSLQLERCSASRAQAGRCEMHGGGEASGDSRAGQATSRGTSTATPTNRKRNLGASCFAAAASEKSISPAQDAPFFTPSAATIARDDETDDCTRVGWIRHRYHLDCPQALLEDTLLRYGRFVDWTVLSTTLARLANSHEAILVSELQGAPEETVQQLVWRQQNYFGGLARLEALLRDPTSQSPPTRRLVQFLLGVDEAEPGSPAAASLSTARTAAVTSSLTDPHTLPLLTVFGGGCLASSSSSSAGSNHNKNTSMPLVAAPLPLPREPPATARRTLAAFLQRLATLFLSCFPCRFVQDGLVELLHQRPDVPLLPRQLLPSLLTYSTGSNESVFEATAEVVPVLRALQRTRERVGRRTAQQQEKQLTYASFSPSDGTSRNASDDGTRTEETDGPESNNDNSHTVVDASLPSAADAAAFSSLSLHRTPQHLVAAQVSRSEQSLQLDDSTDTGSYDSTSSSSSRLISAAGKESTSSHGSVDADIVLPDVPPTPLLGSSPPKSAAVPLQRRRTVHECEKAARGSTEKRETAQGTEPSASLPLMSPLEKEHHASSASRSARATQNKGDIQRGTPKRTERRNTAKPEPSQSSSEVDNSSETSTTFDSDVDSALLYAPDGETTSTSSHKRQEDVTNDRDDDAVNDAQTHARAAQARRNAAALHLRCALTPPLTIDTIMAATTAKLSETDVALLGSTDGAETEGNTEEAKTAPAASQHVVLSYWDGLLLRPGTPARLLDDADVAVYVAYVNTLARDGTAGDLVTFTEQAALQHVQRTDEWRTTPTGAVASSAASPLLSAYRLLHVFSVCAAQQRWAGCVWIYYALGYLREAVALALNTLTEEDEGVRLAVRLLQLLHVRDQRQEHAARAQATHTHGGVARIPSRHDPFEGGGAVSTEELLRQGSRRSRRELWMLVARHLIQACGHAKHGAQTALQLSLRSGDDTFNVTDVLPELPDTLFMTEVKEQLLSAVRQVSHDMRHLSGNTAALASDTRVLRRELQAMSGEPLSMHAEERCVLCGQPALTRPFALYPRCRHLIHVSCYRQAWPSMQVDEAQQLPSAAYRATKSGLPKDPKESDDLLNDRIPVLRLTLDEGSRSAYRAITPALDVTRGAGGERGDGGDTWRGHDSAIAATSPTDAMECLLCARRYLRFVLDAPLSVPLVGDDKQQSTRPVVLR